MAKPLRPIATTEFIGQPGDYAPERCTPSRL